MALTRSELDWLFAYASQAREPNLWKHARDTAPASLASLKTRDDKVLKRTFHLAIKFAELCGECVELELLDDQDEKLAEIVGYGMTAKLVETRRVEFNDWLRRRRSGIEREQSLKVGAVVMLPAPSVQRRSRPIEAGRQERRG